MYYGLVLVGVYWNMDIPADSWYGGISDMAWKYKFWKISKMLYGRMVA